MELRNDGRIGRKKPGTKLSVSQVINPPNLVSDAGTLLEGFENVGDWSYDDAVVSADTTHYITGSQSIRLQADADGATAALFKTVDWDLASMSHILLKVYVTDATKLASAGIGVVLATNGWSAYYGSWQTPTRLRNGWNFIKIAKTDFESEGSANWSDINTLSLFAYSASGQRSDVSFDDLRMDQYSIPKIVLIFDDGWESMVDNFYPYLQARGIRVTVAAVSDVVGNANYLSLEELQSLYADGCDIINHSKSHTDLTALSDENKLIQIETCRDYLITNGMPRGANFFVYPYGAFNDAVRTVAASAGVVLARCEYPPTQQTPIDEPLLLRNALSLSNTTTLGNVQAIVDRIKLEGSTAIIVGHKVLAEPGGDTYAVSTAVAQGLVDYARTEGVEFLTLSEWYGQLSNTRRRSMCM
mgnify:CR=1 FL=1